MRHYRLPQGALRAKSESTNFTEAGTISRTSAVAHSAHITKCIQVA